MTTYNWKRWKIGLFIAMLTGVLSGLVALKEADKLTLTGFLVVVAFNVGKDMLLFLKDHPVEQVVEENVECSANH